MSRIRNTTLTNVVLGLMYGTVKAGNFVIDVKFRQQTVKILRAPGRFSLTAINFAQKPKSNGLIFYFFHIL
jgi:hypothetical protein